MSADIGARTGNPVVGQMARRVVGTVADMISGRGRDSAPVAARTVVFLHGSLSSGGMWKACARALEPEFAAHTPDLIGYGRNPAWPPDRPFRLSDEVGDFAGRINGISAPFDIVAHSYGGAVALRFAWQNAERVRSLTLIEPTCFRVLRDPELGASAERDEIDAVAEAVREGVARGAPEAAMHGFVDYWNGKGAWDMLTDDLRARFAGQAATVARNFAADAAQDMPFGDLRDLDIPTLMVSGSRSTAAARAATRIIGDLLPCVETATIDGAGHMSPVTHPHTTQRLLRNWLGYGLVASTLAA